MDPLADILNDAIDNDAHYKAPPEVIIPHWIAISSFVQDNGINHHDMGEHRFAGAVLCRRAVPKGFDDFAVWSIYYQGDAWERSGGDYLTDINLARFAFGRRVVNNSWGATARGMLGRAE